MTTTPGTSAPTVRRVRAEDAAAWARLFTGYRAFYRLPADDGAVATTWRWVLGELHGMTGRVAVALDDRSLVGPANLRTFARPSTGTIMQPTRTEGA